MTQTANHKPDPAGPIRQNVEAVAKLEEDFLTNRTFSDRVADLIGGFTGSLQFVILHALVYGLWIIINLGWIRGIPRFDPFPFILLSTVVSLEAIFLATFVLMKQNRMSRREDLRAHLDLQVNLLAEREMTLVLQMLQSISARLGLRASPDIEALSVETSLEALANELREKLPDD